MIVLIVVAVVAVFLGAATGKESSFDERTDALIRVIQEREAYKNRTVNPQPPEFQAHLRSRRVEFSRRLGMQRSKRNKLWNG